jgi:hypothetical protein
MFTKLRRGIIALLAAIFGVFVRPVHALLHPLVTRAVTTLHRAGVVLSTTTTTLLTWGGVAALILTTLCVTLALVAPLQAWLFSARLLALTGLQPSHVTQQHVIHWQYHAFPARDTALDTLPHASVALAPLKSWPDTPNSDIGYHIWLELTVPDSAINRQLGTFSVSARAVQGEHVIAEQIRSVVVPYRSRVTRVIYALMFAVPISLGLTQLEEKHAVTVPLHDNLSYEQRVRAFDRFNLTLSHPHLQIYGGTLHLEANLHGISYLFYYWSKLSFITLTLLVYAADLVLVTCFIVVAALAWWLRQAELPRDPAHVREDDEDPREEEEVVVAHKKNDDVAVPADIVPK